MINGFFYPLNSPDVRIRLNDVIYWLHFISTSVFILVKRYSIRNPLPETKHSMQPELRRRTSVFLFCVQIYIDKQSTQNNRRRHFFLLEIVEV